MAESNIPSLFRELAQIVKWSPDEQIEILLTYVELYGTVDTFDTFLATMVEPEDPEEIPAAPAASTAPLTPGLPPVQTAAETAAVTDAFFNRDLARASLAKLRIETHTRHDGVTSGKANATVYELAIHPDVYSWAQQTLAYPGRSPNFAIGEYVGGWQTELPNGQIAAIAIVNGEDHLFVDAFIVLPNAAPADWPNPSLPPRRTIVDDFNFQYPDGSYCVVRVKPVS